jgi:leucyl aminopeptidase
MQYPKAGANNSQERSMNDDDETVIPLHLVFEDDVQSWSGAQPDGLRRWMGEQGWNAEKNRVLLVPGADGRLLAAAYGLGKRGGEINLWQVTGLPERLPPKRYRLAQQMSDIAATQVCLGFAYGAYRFERYRRTPAQLLARLEPPVNADLRFVARADDALRMGRNLVNTPAADLGPAELAGEAARIAACHGAAFRCWEGEELLSAIFRRYTPSGAPARRRRGSPRSAGLRRAPRETGRSS